MKQVHLLTIGEYREAAVALARYAVNDSRGRDVGDPVHEWITEGRRTQYERAYDAGLDWAINMSCGYSSCGDLAHWLLMCLGVTDETIVNRGDDGGDLAWRVSQNISMLRYSPVYVDFRETLVLPESGDIVHVSGDMPGSDHVCVLLDTPDPWQWVTADYGQPHGCLRVCPLRDVSKGLMVRGRMLRGHVSLASLYSKGYFAQGAIVPDDCDVGLLSDNPYLGSRVPEGL